VRDLHKETRFPIGIDDENSAGLSRSSDRAWAIPIELVDRDAPRFRASRP